MSPIYQLKHWTRRFWQHTIRRRQYPELAVGRRSWQHAWKEDSGVSVPVDACEWAVLHVHPWLFRLKGSAVLASIHPSCGSPLRSCLRGFANLVAASAPSLYMIHYSHLLRARWRR